MEEVLRSCAGTGYLVYRIGRGTGRGILAGKKRTNCATFVKASLREHVMDGCCMKTARMDGSSTLLAFQTSFYLFQPHHYNNQTTPIEINQNLQHL